MSNVFQNLSTIEPRYWGKSGWIFLNSIALTYKPEHKDKYYTFITQLPWILPCDSCGENLKKNIHSLENALDSKESFLTWLLNVRNGIYKDNGSFDKIKTLDDNVREIFANQQSNCGMWINIVILCVVLLLLICFYKLIPNMF